jgi:hypothetical protein
MSGSEWGTEGRDADEAAPPIAPASSHVPPPIPPPVWPGGAPESVVAPPPARPKGRILAGAGIVAAVVVALAFKFILPFVVGSVVGSAVSGAFGGPWDRLPSDVKEEYTRRLEAAVGNQLNGLSDAEKTTRVEDILLAGYARLSDDRLVRRLELQTLALHRTDDATCAAFGRIGLEGAVGSGEVAVKMLDALGQSATIEWIGINVEAVEAEGRGSPDPIIVSATESDRAYEELIASLSASELESFTLLSSGGESTDAELCQAVRTLYDASLRLDAQSLEVMARIDIQR